MKKKTISLIYPKNLKIEIKWYKLKRKMPLFANYQIIIVPFSLLA